MRVPVRRLTIAALLMGLMLMLGTLVAQASSPAQGLDPYFETHLGPVPEKPLPSPTIPPKAKGDLFDWSGIDWNPWRDAVSKDPFFAFVAAMAGLAFTFSERLGWRQRVWDAVSANFKTVWGMFRQSKAGWLITEILRRATLPWVGLAIWVAKQVAAIPGVLKGLVTWIVEGTAENIKTTIAFFKADNHGKLRVVQDRIERAVNSVEVAKAFVGVFWENTKATWRRGIDGIARMWTDPDISNEELMQWGADHASMAADASLVISGAAAVGRLTKGTSWFGELGMAAQAREAAAISKAAQVAGHSRVTSAVVVRVLRAADQDIKFTEFITKLSGSEQEAVAFLLQKGVLRIQGDGLRFAPHLLNPGNLAVAPDVMSQVEARYQVMLHGAPGINLTPMSTVRKYPAIGRNGTFLTDARAVEEIIGPVPSSGNRIRISSTQARELERALGLVPNSLEQENILSVVEGIPQRAPRRPAALDGNEFFLGEGKGLPGGGPEVLVDSIPSSGGYGIRQIILEVIGE